MFMVQAYCVNFHSIIRLDFTLDASLAPSIQMPYETFKKHITYVIYTDKQIYEAVTAPFTRLPIRPIKILKAF
jgi:hypothetical protein